jgi:hypothetical protein
MASTRERPFDSPMIDAGGGASVKLCDVGLLLFFVGEYFVGIWGGF